MQRIITLLVAAFMTLAVFSQTPSTIGVALHPRTSRVVGSGTNLFTANADRAVATLDTVARLATITNAVHGSVVDVRGYDAENDLPYPLSFTLNTNSVATTNRFTIANAGGDGRWIHDWNGDVRLFGAQPYHPKHTLVPWGYKCTNTAIGTGAFSVWIRTTLPSTYTQPFGGFEMSRVPHTNEVTELASSFGFRATPDTWGFLLRGTNGSSATGSTVDEASSLDASPSALSAYAGQTVNLVVTRNGTNAAVYVNGTDLTGSFTLSNPAGWAKSIALGESVFVQVGNNANIWYWPKPVTRFAIWNSALNSSQAGDPEATSGKVLDYTPDETSEPTDSTVAFNAARQYRESQGGGRIDIPSGCYRIDGEIKVGKSIAWFGSGASDYPSTFRQGFRPSPTTLVPWFGATNWIFKADQTQSGEVCLTARVISTLGNSLISSRWLRSTIRDLTFCGDLSHSSGGVFLDRVAAITLQNLGIRNLPGEPLLAYGVNSLQVNKVAGVMGRGFHLRGVADVVMTENFADGAKGPGLWFVGNLCRVTDSVFEYGNDPRTSVPPFEWSGSVDASTDTITVTTSYGHRLQTGQVVRFDAASGTLPSPLNATNAYYVIRTGANTFKVSTQYADEVSGTGAVYGNAVVDITDTGSGTWYVGGGESVGMIITGDRNSFSDIQSQNNYEGGARLETSTANSFVGCKWVMNGLGNTSTNIPAVNLASSPGNTFSNNGTDDRDLAGYSQFGFVGDSASTSNFLSGNSVNIDFPYSLGSANRVIVDAGGIMGEYTGSSGNLYIPATSGFSLWTPRSGFTNSASIQYDTSSRRIFNIYGGAVSYAVGFTNGPNLLWGGSSGTLSGINNGTGQTMLALNSVYTGAQIFQQANSATTAEGVRNSAYRNGGTNSANYAAVGSGAQIYEHQYWGWHGSGSGDVSIAAAIEAAAGAAFSTTNTPGQINLKVTPWGSASSRQTVFSVGTTSAPATNQALAFFGIWNGSGITLKKVAVTNIGGVDYWISPP